MGGNFSLPSGDDDLVYYHNNPMAKAGTGIIGAMRQIEKLKVYKEWQNM